MASKGAKETIANKLGFKSHGQKSVETELEKVRKENAQLKKTLDEISKRNAKPIKGCESDQGKLMEVSFWLFVPVVLSKYPIVVYNYTWVPI